MFSFAPSGAYSYWVDHVLFVILYSFDHILRAWIPNGNFACTVPLSMSAHFDVVGDSKCKGSR